MSLKRIAKAALCAALSAFAVPLLLFAQGQASAQTQAPTQTPTQNNAIASRITQAIDETNLTRLTGNTHPLAQARFDQGAAPDSLPMQRMLLVLKRSPAQEAALDALLDQQQDSTSPNYHQWLTPQQFGQQFGPSDQDIQTITNWLQSHGFTVAGVSNGRTVIEFSGTAGQVHQAFHTEIHRYTT
jgi:subtilase family serine protease